MAVLLGAGLNASASSDTLNGLPYLAMLGYQDQSVQGSDVSSSGMSLGGFSCPNNTYIDGAIGQSSLGLDKLCFTCSDPLFFSNLPPGAIYLP